MEEAFYRLGEYKIITSAAGQVMWETHFGFGEAQRGPCYIKGSILFIGPAERCGVGFLKGEFLDDLKRYAMWSKTKFYCSTTGVHRCKSGRPVTKEDMVLWVFGRGRNKRLEQNLHSRKDSSNSTNTGEVIEGSVYRLQQHEIVIRADGRIFSRTCSGPNNVSSGDCFVLEGILFIGPHDSRSISLDRRHFAAYLDQQPRWDQTEFFCKSSYLSACDPGNRIQAERRKVSQEVAVRKNDAESKQGRNTGVRILGGADRASFYRRVSAVLDAYGDSLKQRGGFSGIFKRMGSRFPLWEGMERIRTGAKKALKKTNSVFSRLPFDSLKKRYERWNKKR